MTIQAIIDALAPEPLEGEHGAVVLKLRAIAETMCTVLGPRIAVQVEPGARDEFAFVLFTHGPFVHREVLFRGRLPSAGFPVTLDFFEDTRRVASTLEDLEVYIADFLRRPDVRRRLTALRGLATQGS